MEGKKKIIIIYIIQLFITQLAFGDSPRQWTLSPIYEARVNQLITADLENDGTDEFVECIGPYIYIKDQSGVFKRQITFDTDRLGPLGAYNINDRLPCELLICVIYGDTVYLALNSDRKYKIFGGKNINPIGPPGYDGRIGGIILDDINNDGYDDLICAVSTGYDLYPRGIIAYDIAHDRELWHTWSADFPIMPMEYIDINEDQEKELIVGTFAPGNGVVVDGESDSQSHVRVLNRRGELLWEKEVGDVSTGIVIWAGDINNDDKKDIVACETYGLAQSKKSNHIYILDALTGQTIKYIAVGEKFMGLKVCDYDRDNRMDIITGNSDGILRVFNAQLECVEERQFDNTVILSQIEDLDGNGTNEIILTTNSGQIIILNEKLDIICQYESPKGRISNCILAREGKRFNIVARINIGYENINIVLKIKNLAAISTIPYNKILCVIFVLLILILLYMVLIKLKERRIILNLIDNAPLGVIVLNKNNRIKYCNLETRKFIGESDERLHNFIESDEIRKNITSLDPKTTFKIDYNNKHFEIKLFSDQDKKILAVCDKTTEMTSQDLIAWSGVAQRLAHEIKNPLSTINLALQQMKEKYKDGFGDSGHDFEYYANLILGEVVRLRETTDKFMRILSLDKSVMISCDIKDLVITVLERYGGKLPQGINIQQDFSKDPTMVKCDESQMIMLFTNIIDNAIQAMAGKGVLTIHTSLIDKITRDMDNNKIIKYVDIEIEDTGHGISTDNIKNLFKPFNTTKPGGTGIGLIIAKRIVEEHRGFIRIDSKKNVGTVVHIELPIE